jgi:hypothetical protein
MALNFQLPNIGFTKSTPVDLGLGIDEFAQRAEIHQQRPIIQFTFTIH